MSRHAVLTKKCRKRLNEMGSMGWHCDLEELGFLTVVVKEGLAWSDKRPGVGQVF